MDLQVLKIDLDARTRKEAIEILAERIRYFDQIMNVKPKYWTKIELIHKTSYGARIRLLKPLKDVRNIIILECCFGSDWRKEINTYYNAVVLGMDYSNRLFLAKRYGSKYIIGTKEDVTAEVLERSQKTFVINWRKFLIAKVKRWFKW